MALIDFIEGAFVGRGSWDERALFKDAGFEWNGKRKAWLTRNRKHAEAVQGVVWSDAALRHIEDRDYAAKLSAEMSYKAGTTFEPPIPQALLDKGWDFKPYQKAGIEFASMPGRRDTLIADPPGLGKTIQAIGVSNCFPKSIKRVLVICPASLKENWRREWLTWCSKGMSVGIAETQRREMVQDGFYKNGKPRFKKVVHPRWWPNTQVVIINYDILEKFSEEINDRFWDLLVCDEAQALKSPDSGRTLFVLGDDHLDTRTKKRKRAERKKKDPEFRWFRAVDAKRRLFLSGTPMMNRPIELWPLVRACDPEGLGEDYLEFGYRYCEGFFDASRGSQGAYNFSGASNLRELGQRLRQRMMVRRQKREVLPELPPVFKQVVLLDSPEIKEIVAREDEIAQAMRLYEAAFADPSEDARDERIGNEVLEAVYQMGFEDAAKDPDRPNAKRLNMEYAQAVTGLEGPAVQVMFEEMAAVRRELGLAKVSAVIPWLKQFLTDTEEKLILFAYHSDVVLALAEALQEFNPAVIYGGTPVGKRQGQVDKFQTDDTCRVIIGNIQAAGVGFTMTKASSVAFAEGDWVPSQILQCIDRACRIGQLAEKIIAFFLVANGSLDARIAQSSQLKEENINEVMDT